MFESLFEALRRKSRSPELTWVVILLFVVRLLRFEVCVLALLLVLAWYFGMDLARRYWPEAEQWLFDHIFKNITRPRERYIIPAATWYALAILIVLVTTEKTLAQVSVVILGVGDPAATLIGRRFGKLKLYKQKSVAGFIGFVVVSFLSVGIWLAVTRPEMALGRRLGLGLVGALTGAVAELFGDDRIDDNMTIPISSAVVLSLLF